MPKTTTTIDMPEDIVTPHPSVMRLISIEPYEEFGYVVHTKICEHPDDVEVATSFGVAYNLDGNYIGSEEQAKSLCQDKGIKPEVAMYGDKTCSVGFCDKEQKWYGWSHRALYGFGIGDIVEEGDATASSGMTEECAKQFPGEDYSLQVGFKAETLADARCMAVAFADSVS